jgi:hypothetical protein
MGTPQAGDDLYDRVAAARTRVFELADEVTALCAEVTASGRCPGDDPVFPSVAMALQEAANELGRLEALLAETPGRRFSRSPDFRGVRTRVP